MLRPVHLGAGLDVGQGTTQDPAPPRRDRVQVLGFPRTDAGGAEQLSKAIGTATFVGRTESKSGTVAESRIDTANTQWQAGEYRLLVRERLVTPNELTTLGPDRQYVIAAPKDMPRDALHLHHAR